MTALEPVPRSSSSGISHTTLPPLSAPGQSEEALQGAADCIRCWKTEPFRKAEGEESQTGPQEGNFRDPELMIDQDVGELHERGTVGGTFGRGAKRTAGLA